MKFAFLQKKYAVVVVALSFIVISLLKILSFPQFILDVQRFDILPPSIILPFSIFIVLIELTAAFGLLFGIYSKYFSWILIILLSLFTVGIIINLLRGNIIDCGCFGDTFSVDISWFSVIRNIIFVVILYLLFLEN